MRRLKRAPSLDRASQQEQLARSEWVGVNGFGKWPRRWPASASLSALGDEITIERLEHAVALAAYIVLEYGDAYVHTLERLEKELVAMRQQETPRAKAERLLKAYGGRAGFPDACCGGNAHGE